MPATNANLSAPPRITVKGGQVTIRLDFRDQAQATQFADRLAARPIEIEGRKPIPNPWPEATVMFAPYGLLHW